MQELRCRSSADRTRVQVVGVVELEKAGEKALGWRTVVVAGTLVR